MNSSRYGRLVVLTQAPDALIGKRLRRRRQWVCKCDCGNERTVLEASLKDGLTKSCGCLSRERTIARSTKHGGAGREKRSPTYRSWLAMRTRVDWPDERSAKYYRDRGITVCEHWRDFRNFLADMGERPAGTTLDRRDNDKGYEPGNCRWATTKEQTRNKRNTVRVAVQGQVMCLVDAAALAGLDGSTVHTRLRRGLPINKAFAKVRSEPSLDRLKVDPEFDLS